MSAKPVVRCKSCGADIVWFKTPAGRNMPVNAAGVYEADSAYDPAKHMSHFVTCPQAGMHRKLR